MKHYILLSRLALCVVLLGTGSYIVSMVNESYMSDFIDDSSSDYSDSDSGVALSKSKPKNKVSSQELILEQFETLTLDEQVNLLVSLENSTKKESKKLYAELAQSIDLEDIKPLISQFSNKERTAILDATKKPNDKNIRKVENALVRAYLNANKDNTEELNALYEATLSYYSPIR